MIQSLKARLLYPWNLVRVMRVGIGGIALYQAYDTNDWWVSILGILLLSQGLFSWGCCSVNACTPSGKNNKSEVLKDVEYEELN